MPTANPVLGGWFFHEAVLAIDTLTSAVLELDAARNGPQVRKPDTLPQLGHAAYEPYLLSRSAPSVSADALKVAAARVARIQENLQRDFITFLACFSATVKSALSQKNRDFIGTVQTETRATSHAPHYAADTYVYVHVYTPCIHQDDNCTAHTSGSQPRHK